MSTAPGGSQFCLSAGIYHIKDTVRAKTGDSFTGVAGTTLDGGLPVKGWTLSGATWVATLPVSKPTLVPNTPKGTLFAPQSVYSNDLFLGESQLTKVGVKYGGTVKGQTRSAVGPGDYFVDYDAHKVYLGTNPTGKAVEISSARIGIMGGSTVNNVHVQGLVMEKFTGNGVNDSGGSGWTINDVNVRYVHNAGIHISNNATVTNSSSNHNGVYGITGSGSGEVVSGSEFAFNDDSGYRLANGVCFGSGGSKWVYTVNLLVKGSSFHDNYCNGLWLDINNKDSTVTNNQVYNNRASGFVDEISYTALVQGNIIRGNLRGGVVVRNSSNLTFTGNTVSGNGGNALMLNENDRSRSPHIYGATHTDNADIEHNQLSGGVVGAQGLTTVFSASFNNRFNNNTYTLPSTTTRYYKWKSGKCTFASWQSAGQDLASSLITG